MVVVVFHYCINTYVNRSNFHLHYIVITSLDFVGIQGFVNLRYKIFAIENILESVIILTLYIKSSRSNGFTKIIHCSTCISARILRIYILHVKCNITKIMHCSHSVCYKKTKSICKNYQ